jgi:hypothetical protein
MMLFLVPLVAISASVLLAAQKQVQERYTFSHPMRATPTTVAAMVKEVTPSRSSRSSKTASGFVT